MLILLFALFFCLLIAAGVLIRVLSLPLFPLVHRRALILFALSFFCLLSILLFALYSFVCSLFFCLLSILLFTLSFFSSSSHFIAAR